MYVPRHFAETRVEVLHGLIRRHPLGTLVVAAPEGLEASHVPFEISPDPAPFGTLRCHVARANPIWQKLAADRQVLVVFQGEQTYVSPSWYVAEPESSRVPTWNYAAVHAVGRARMLGDDETSEMLERLVAEHERDGWRPEMSTRARQGMLRAIVGFEVEAPRLEGKLKLSQNRSPADRERVRAALAETGHPDLAALMTRR